MGGLVRLVICHHLVFLVNSAAHTFGTRPYTDNETARDSWWLAFFTYGEGYHNFHHRFPADYRNGHRWYHFDPSKWWISALKRVGLVYRTTSHDDVMILKARIEVEVRQFRRTIAHLPESCMAYVDDHLTSAREALETAAAQWQATRNRYRERSLGDSETRIDWQRKLRACRSEYLAARERWASLLSDTSWLDMAAHEAG